MKTIISRKREKQKVKPDFICFGIIDDCILKCKMCRKWKEDIFIKDRTGAPTLEDWKRCVNSLKKITDKPIQINFGGGEPLLKEGLWELVSFCKSKRLDVNIATNGYLIDENTVKKISDSRLDSIILSLDSLQEDTHDYLRGVKGVYRAVMGAISSLDKSCSELYKGICSVIYDKNIEDVVKLAEWVDNDKRLNSVYFMAAMQPNNTVLDAQWYLKEEFDCLWPKDPLRACVVIDELIKLKKNNSKITNQVCQLEAFKLYYQFPERFVKSTKCNMGSALHISSCGDIFLCYHWGKLGNIKTDDIAQLWSSDNAAQVREDIGNCKNNCHFLLNCYFKGDYPFTIE
ncbi:MAG: radical SAM protein [Candidatus Omnitrophica bacterium]|nr:radical SAM protein [Candidatus Omnitrophota bacterium]